MTINLLGYSDKKKSIKVMALTGMMVLCTAAAAAAGTGRLGNDVNNISTIKLPKTVNVVKSDQKTLLLGNGQQGIQQYLQNMGLLSSDIYQLRYKDGSDFRYGLVADIRPGQMGLLQLGLISDLDAYYRNTNNYLQALAEKINDGGSNNVMPYSVITPLTKSSRGNTYEGVLQVVNRKDNMTYSETLHVILYNSDYFGAAARVVVLDTGDDSWLWRVVEPLAKVSK